MKKFIFLAALVSALTAESALLPAQASLTSSPDEIEIGKTSAGRPLVILVNGYSNCCIQHTNIIREYLKNFSPEIILTPWSRFLRTGGNAKVVDDDGHFIRFAPNYINSIPKNRPVVLLGHSFGGDSILKILSKINRPIEFVGIYDATAFGGYRTPTTIRPITTNVKYFFNRWQENGFKVKSASNNVPFDSRTSGRIKTCLDRLTICDQHAQKLVRNFDNTAVKKDCSADFSSTQNAVGTILDWGIKIVTAGQGGCDEDHHERLNHGSVPSDAYIQRKTGEAIERQLNNFYVSFRQKNQQKLDRINECRFFPNRCR